MLLKNCPYKLCKKFKSPIWQHLYSNLLRLPRGSDAEASLAVSELKVLSRARPLDKLRLVKLLQQKGEVVGVTGDGKNDAA